MVKVIRVELLGALTEVIALSAVLFFVLLNGEPGKKNSNRITNYVRSIRTMLVVFIIYTYILYF